MNKKILVACADYPNLEGGKALSFVHTRNKYYQKHDITTVVLNFNAKNGYEIDGIKVISFHQYLAENEKYETLICHAPNIRNHYRFLMRYEHRFKKIIFIFHGHEILKIRKTYPKPYKFKQRSIFDGFIQNTYDCYKIHRWSKYFKKISYKSYFVFVSNSLFLLFGKFLKLTSFDLKGHVNVINNSVGSLFLENNYDIRCEKKYDFITIRSNLDESTYAIDLINDLAKNNPNFNFLLVGNGKFFKYESKAQNIDLIEGTFSHENILKLVDDSKCAIMLIKHDTQGVMSCELATYGIPLITSNISVCREIFKTFKNVVFVDNKNNIDLEQVFNEVTTRPLPEKNAIYSAENTTQKEVDLIKNDIV